MFYPRWIQLQLTEICNLNCKMCYERKSNAYNEKQAILDVVRLKEIISECSQNSPHYELFGGEPLMYPYLEELLEYIYRQKSKVTIPTNGTILKKKAHMLPGKSVERVWVSLDGPELINNKQRGANSYKKVLDGIVELYSQRQKFQSEYPKIGVHCVVTADNYHSIHDLVHDTTLMAYTDDFSFELQKYLTEAKFLEYSSYLGGKEALYAKGYVQDLETFGSIDFKQLYTTLQTIRETCKSNNKGFFTNPDKLDEASIRNYFAGNWEKITAFHKSCSFPFVYAEISARGEVTQCHSFFDDVLGNIYQDNLLEIWNNEKANKLRKLIRKQLLPICYACCSFYNTENKA